MKTSLFVSTLAISGLMALSAFSGTAFAGIQCTGWIGPKDVSTSTPLKIETMVDTDWQTVLTGTANGIYADLFFR